MAEKYEKVGDMVRVTYSTQLEDVVTGDVVQVWEDREAFECDKDTMEMELIRIRIAIGALQKEDPRNHIANHIADLKIEEKKREDRLLVLGVTLKEVTR